MSVSIPGRLAPGVRAADLGAAVPLLVCGYRRGTARTRTTYRHLLGLSLVLAVFGMLVDGVATGVGDSGLQLLHLLEDGGELLAMTAVLGYVVRLVVGER